MPLWSFLWILVWIFRLSQMLGRNWYQVKAFIFEWKKLILASKCLSNGIIGAVWFMFPSSASKLLALIRLLIRYPGYYFSRIWNWDGVSSCTMCVCCIPILIRLWPLLIPLQLLILMDRSFRLLVPVIFDLMVVRSLGLQLALLRFLWLCCCQYQ